MSSESESEELEPRKDSHHVDKTPTPTSSKTSDTDVQPEASASTKLFAEMKEEGAETDSIDGQIVPGYGDPYQYDPDFKGPLEDRSCTDVICCFIFLVFMLGMVVVSIIGFARGNPEQLIHPTDSFGEMCGIGKYEHKPYLVFFDLNRCAMAGPDVLSTGCPTPQVCVSKCPKKNYVYLEALVTDDRSELICQNFVDHSKDLYKKMSVQDLVEKELCAAYYLESAPVLSRCVPDIFSKLTSNSIVKDENGDHQLQTSDGTKLNAESIYNGTKTLMDVFQLSGKLEMAFNDVKKSGYIILVFLALAALFACVWIILLRWLTFIMVWLTIFFFIGIFGFASGYSYVKYYQLKNMNITSEENINIDFELNLDHFLNNKKVWLGFGCTTATIFTIFLLIIFFMCSRISLAVNLISEASVALSHMWSVLLWPIFPFVLQFLILAYWIFSSLYLISMGRGQFYNATTSISKDINALLNRVPCDHSKIEDSYKDFISIENGTLPELCTFVKYGGEDYKKPMLIFQLFMFFWLMNFVAALGHMTLAGAFASYYWSWDKSRDMPMFPVISSLLRSLRYHMGSLAFGSCIISIVQLIRAILELISRKLKSSENEVAKFLMKCLSCCFWCLEKFLRFVNMNAYIVIAVHGNNFCSGAKDGFFLIMRNVLRAAVLDKVCDFIMFISKLMVAAATGTLTYFWLKNDDAFFEGVVPKLNFIVVPIVLVVIGAYIVADCFFDVYVMGVDTLFLCFLEDIERNDGSPEKPYYMMKTKNLRHLLVNPK